MKEGKISVIIPVYNAEKFLQRCVDSVLAQTYRNIEVILVDDGSSDKSPAICDSYQELDERVKVIHRENGGVSRARNTGLDSAEGDYIGFVDSDDWIDPDMYETLMRMMIRTNSDIGQIAFSMEASDITSNSREEEHITVLTRDEMLDGSIFCSIRNPNRIDFASACRKLIDRNVIGETRFTVDITIGEDDLFCASVIANCHSFVLSDRGCYHYFQNDVSASHVFKESSWSVMRAADKIYELGIRVKPDRKEFADVRLVWMDYLLMLRVVNNGYLTKERYQKLRKHMKPHISLKVFHLLPWLTGIYIFIFCLGWLPFLTMRKMRDLCR